MVLIEDPSVFYSCSFCGIVIPFSFFQFPGVCNVAVGGKEVPSATDRSPRGALDHGSVFFEIVFCAGGIKDQPACHHFSVFGIKIVPFAAVFDPSREHVAVFLVKIVPASGFTHPSGPVGSVRVFAVGPAVLNGELSGGKICAYRGGFRGRDPGGSPDGESGRQHRSGCRQHQYE